MAVLSEVADKGRRLNMPFRCDHVGPQASSNWLPEKVARSIMSHSQFQTLYSLGVTRVRSQTAKNILESTVDEDAKGCGSASEGRRYIEGFQPSNITPLASDQTQPDIFAIFTS